MSISGLLAEEVVTRDKKIITRYYSQEKELGYGATARCYKVIRETDKSIFACKIIAKSNYQRE
jgi:hypothetical protein